MCCFSGRVERVDATQIFARMLAPGRQGLVYALKLAAKADVAMILPLPVPAGADESAVRFVALDGYASFFDDLARAFPVSGLLSLAPQSRSPPRRQLAVVEVGAFVASFVPTLADFGRLDARFRLPAGTLDRVPGYADWGFAVFQLGKGDRKIHPMAFDFPTRHPGALFFPTVHVHDGALHREAQFAHTLYGQGVPQPSSDGWFSSVEPLGSTVDAVRARGLVDPDAPVSQKSLFGKQPNQDVWAAL